MGQSERWNTLHRLQACSCQNLNSADQISGISLWAQILTTNNGITYFFATEKLSGKLFCGHDQFQILKKSILTRPSISQKICVLTTFGALEIWVI